MPQTSMDPLFEQQHVSQTPVDCRMTSLLSRLATLKRFHDHYKLQGVSSSTVCNLIIVRAPGHLICSCFMCRTSQWVVEGIQRFGAYRVSSAAMQLPEARW